MMLALYAPPDILCVQFTWHPLHKIWGELTSFAQFARGSWWWWVFEELARSKFAGYLWVFLCWTV